MAAHAPRPRTSPMVSNSSFQELRAANGLQDYTLFFLGTIAASQENREQARGHFARLKNDFPQSVWLNKANLQLAKILLEEGDGQGAIELLGTLGEKGVDAGKDVGKKGLKVGKKAGKEGIKAGKKAAKKTKKAIKEA